MYRPAHDDQDVQVAVGGHLALRSRTEQYNPLRTGDVNNPPGDFLDGILQGNDAKSHKVSPKSLYQLRRSAR